MNVIIYDFSSEWYIMLSYAILLWALFSFIRKDISGSIKFGLIGLAIAIITELIGVGTNLWNYSGGNWPVILWPTYFIFSMAFYQIVKVLEKKRMIRNAKRV